MSNSNIEQNDKKINNKFDYLLNEVTRTHRDNEYFSEMNRLITNKYQELVDKIDSRIGIKCKNQIETLQVYTEYNKDLFNNQVGFQSLKPNRGYEKEFDNAMKNLNLCKDELNFMAEDIKISSKAISDLTVLSKNACLDQCRADIVKIKNSEYETRKCIEACFRYSKYNLQAYTNIMFENIDKKMEII